MSKLFDDLRRAGDGTTQPEPPPPVGSDLAIAASAQWLARVGMRRRQVEVVDTSKIHEAMQLIAQEALDRQDPVAAPEVEAQPAVSTTVSDLNALADKTSEGTLAATDNSIAAQFDEAIQRTLAQPAASEAVFDTKPRQTISAVTASSQSTGPDPEKKRAKDVDQAWSVLLNDNESAKPGPQAMIKPPSIPTPPAETPAAEAPDTFEATPEMARALYRSRIAQQRKEIHGASPDASSTESPAEATPEAAMKLYRSRLPEQREAVRTVLTEVSSVDLRAEAARGRDRPTKVESAPQPYLIKNEVTAPVPSAPQLPPLPTAETSGASTTAEKPKRITTAQLFTEQLPEPTPRKPGDVSENCNTAATRLMNHGHT